MNTIKDNYRVCKSFELNMIENQLNLQEKRLFTVYLACINPKDVNTKTVIIRLCDFQRIFDFKHLWESEIKHTFKRLLSHTLFISKNGELNAFQIFKHIRLYTKDGEKVIELTAHDEAIPYLFNIQGKYFSYKLWNILQLSSVNQFMLYELLKQYEKKGERELNINALKELIGISADSYPNVYDFKKKVLDVCQEALRKYTDISFDYSPCKIGQGGKWETILFTIKPNKPESELDELIKQDMIEVIAITPQKEPHTFLGESLPHDTTAAPHPEGAAASPLHDLHTLEPESRTAPEPLPHDLTADTHPESEKVLHKSLGDLTDTQSELDTTLQENLPEGITIEMLLQAAEESRTKQGAHAGTREPNNVQAPEPFTLTAHKSQKEPHKLPSRSLSPHNLTANEETTNSDIIALNEIFPEFSIPWFKAAYLRIIEIEPDNTGTKRIDCFIKIYKDTIALHGNNIRNLPAYMMRVLDDYREKMN